MYLFERSKITIVRNNCGKSFRKMLKLDRRDIHIMTGTSEIRKYSRVAKSYITRDVLFVFELRNSEILRILEEHILIHGHEKALYVIETIRFDKALHDMLDEIAMIHGVSIVVRVG